MKRIVRIMLSAWVLASLLSSNALLAAAETGLTRTHSGGGVTLEATYLNPESNADARFRVVLDTHSVNLDGYDLQALSLLRDDAGRSYQPTRVENKGSGHHREIILVFPSPSPGGKRLDLVIKDVARVNERIFSWDLP